MDEDRIGVVLAKTSELRSKIITCIHKASNEIEVKESDSKAENQEQDDVNFEVEGDEGETLLNIKDALESLESQLSSLQALQQQQWYEKEAALAEIEHSQKKLLKELKEYKGKNLVVIHEAIAFAGETEDNNDLLLPPYPSRPSQPIVSDNGYLSTFSSTSKFSQNGVILKDHHEVHNDFHKSESNQRQPGPRGPFKRLKVLIGAAARSTITILGVITILSLAGYEPRLRKRDNNQFKPLDFFQVQRENKKQNTVECPPGKVLVIENGEMLCVVKERVEIPFESVVAPPDVNYGCG